MKKAIRIILIFALLVLFGLGVNILFQPKGEWVCQEGEWVKLGQPKEAPPSSGCFKVEEKKPQEKKESQESAGTPLNGFQVPGSEQWNLVPAGLKKATSSAENETSPSTEADGRSSLRGCPTPQERLRQLADCSRCNEENQ